MIKLLKKRMLVYIAGIFLAILTIVMIILYITIQDTLYDNAKQSAYSIANSIYIALDDSIFNTAQLVTFIGNDPFITKDLFENESSHADIIPTYLKNIQNIYGYDIVHIASFDSLKYYSADGSITTFSESNPEDQWFFDLKNESLKQNGYQPFMKKEGDTIIFNNIYTITDTDGKVNGIILIGMDYTKSLESIKESIAALNATVFVVSPEGVINRTMLNALNGSSETEITSEVLMDMSPVQANPSESFVQTIKGNASISFKYIKEMNSYLVIAQDLSPSILYNFVITLLVVIFILACILLVMLKFLDYSNRKIFDEASLDPLTNVYNRSVFNNKLNEALELCAHYQIISSFIFIDIDDFKVINDEMGHAVGDEIIIKVAELLNDCKRKNDLLFRWGGDEFGLIVRSNLESTELLAQRILDRAHDIHWRESCPISLSIGITEIQNSDTKKLVFNRVDEALYQAKANGKNQIYAKVSC